MESDATTDSATTEYRISGDGYLLIGWCALTLLFCLPGNTLVLLASIKYKAIKLDKVATILIENIAVADICVALFAVLPRMVSVIAEKWEYGCTVTSLATIIFPGVSIQLIAALNVSKLTCLLFPLRARTRTYTQGRIIALSLWAGILLLVGVLEIVPFITLGEPLYGFYFDYHYMCDLDPQPEIRALFYSVIVVCTFIPMIVMILTTIWLIVYVQRVRGLSKESVVTLIAISVVFFVSYIPISSRIIPDTFVNGMYDKLNELRDDPDADYEAIVKKWDDLNEHYKGHYYAFTYGVQYVNCMVNPIIYFFTIKSFQTFVVDLVRRVLGRRNLCTNNRSFAQTVSTTAETGMVLTNITKDITMPSETGI